MTMLLTVGGAPVLTIWTVAGMLQASAAAVEEKREQLGLLGAITATRPLLEASRGSSKDATAFVEGDTEALVYGNMQARLRLLAETAGVNLMALGNVPPHDIEGVRFVGISLDASGQYGGLLDLIQQIETIPPQLIVQEASLWTGPQTEGNPVTPTMTAQLKVFAPLKPELLAKNPQ